MRKGIIAHHIDGRPEMIPQAYAIPSLKEEDTLLDRGPANARSSRSHCKGCQLAVM